MGTPRTLTILGRIPDIYIDPADVKEIDDSHAEKPRAKRKFLRLGVPLFASLLLLLAVVVTGGYFVWTRL